MQHAIWKAVHTAIQLLLLQGTDNVQKHNTKFKLVHCWNGSQDRNRFVGLFFLKSIITTEQLQPGLILP